MLIFWTFFLMPILLHVECAGSGDRHLRAGADRWRISVAFGTGGHRVDRRRAAAGGVVARASRSWQALRHVILPQAVRVMMPSFVNQWVSLVKDTSLAYIVGVPEFTFLANQLNNRLMVYPAQIFLIVGLVYLLLCGALQWSASRLLRRHVGVPERGAQPQNIGHPHAVRK